MEDAAGFFANVFGGERFMDYVSGLLLGLFLGVNDNFYERLGKYPL